MQIALFLLVTFCLSAAFVACLIPIGHRFGLIDVPSGHRAHRGATPLVGGIAMYCAIVLSSGLFYSIYGFGYSNALFVACALLVFMGVLDDRHKLNVRLRLAVEISASFLVIYYDDTVIRSLGPLLNSETLHLGIFAVPVTIFSIVGVVNAMNMMDGLDGLAGMVAVAIFLFMVVLAASAGLSELCLLVLCLLGITAGFLLHNFPFDTNKSATVFMGDAGSTLLGFLIAVLLVRLAGNGADVLHPVTALWLLGLLLYDTLGVMARRVWLKQSPFKADRNHLHHILLDAGFRVRDVVLILFALQIGFGLIGLLGLFCGASDAFMFYLFLAGWLVYLYIFISPWRLVPNLQKLHAHVSLSRRDSKRIFIGNLPTTKPEALATVCELLSDHIVSTFHLLIKTGPTGNVVCCYCVVLVRADFDVVLRDLRDRSHEPLVIREYRTREGMKWLPFLARKAVAFFWENVHGRSDGSTKTYLIYSSIRDSKHRDYYGRSQRQSVEHRLPVL